MHKQLGFFFQNVILSSNIIFYHFGPINEYSVSTVGTDGLVPWHQDISNHSAEDTPMPVVYGLIDVILMSTSI